MPHCMPGSMARTSTLFIAMRTTALESSVVRRQIVDHRQHAQKHEEAGDDHARHAQSLQKRLAKNTMIATSARATPTVIRSSP